MFLICSKGFKVNYYATKIVVPLKSDHEIKDQILVHQVPTSHGFKRQIDSQSQHQTMFSENVKIDYTLKSGHKNAFVVYLYISLRNCYFYPFLSNNINKQNKIDDYLLQKEETIIGIAIKISIMPSRYKKTKQKNYTGKCLWHCPFSETQNFIAYFHLL